MVAGVERVQDLGGAVAASVVDEEDLERPARFLFQDRYQAGHQLIQVLALVVDGEDDGYQRCHQYPRHSRRSRGRCQHAHGSSSRFGTWPQGPVQGEPSDRGDAIAAGHHSGDGVVSGASAPLRPGAVAAPVQCASGALSVLRAHGEHCQPEELPGGAEAGVAEVVGPSQPAGADVVGALWAAAAAPSLAGGVGAAFRVPEGLTVNLSLKSRVREIRSHGSAGA